MEFQNRYYRFMRDTFRNPVVLAADPAEISKAIRGLPSKATYYQHYLAHKFRHTLHVLRAGTEIMEREPQLSGVNDRIKQQWMDAIILHDIGRINDVAVDSPTEVSVIPHGSVSFYMASTQLQENSLQVLLPILMHDQLNNDLLNLSDEELNENRLFKTYTAPMKHNLLDVRKRYQQTSPEEKQLIDLGCKMIQDADKLGNIREYKKLLTLAYPDKTPDVDPEIERQIFQKRMIDYKLRKNFADCAVGYIGWTFGYNFPSSFVELNEKKINQGLAAHTVDVISRKNPGKDITDFSKRIHAMADFADAYSTQQMDKVNSVTKKQIDKSIQNYLFRSSAQR